MKFTAVALSAVASIAAASPALFKRDATLTDTIVDENGSSLVRVLELVDAEPTSTTTATTTTTTTTTSVTALVDVPSSAILDNLEDALASLLGSGDNQGPIGDLVSNVGDTAGNVIGDLASGVGNVASDVASGAGGLLSDVGAAVGDIGDAVGDIAGGL